MDQTLNIRRTMLLEINAAPSERAALESQHGQVWNPDELARDFEVLGFMAPFVVARRKSDGVLGSLMLQHHPRFYFAWAKDSQQGPQP